MKERLKELRKNHKCGKTQDMFANFLGISKSNLASYEAGRRTPSDAVIQLICEKCGVSEDWLRNGVGDMFKQRDGSFSEMLSELDDSDDDFIKSFVAVYMELDEDSKEVLRKTARKMAEKRKKPD